MDEYPNDEYDFLNTITAEEFGKRMAAVALDLRSSHVTFMIQQAFKDLSEFGIEWKPLENFLTRIANQTQNRKEKPSHEAPR